MKKSNLLLNALVILVSTFLVSCASIVDGGDKVLTFKSVPDDANVSVTNIKTGKEIASGTTPASIMLPRKSGFFKPAHYLVTITKGGYKPYEIRVSSTISGWYAGNIIFGGLLGIIIVDPATGAMWKFNPHEYNAALVSNTTSSAGSTLKVMTLSELTPEQRSHLVPLATTR